MTPHVCVICNRDLEAGYACHACQTRLDHTLAEIVDLYATLPDQLEPGRGTGQRISGSREAPLPLQVNPLDLSLPLRSLQAIHDPEHDQVGHVPVAAELASWVREWRESGAPGDQWPSPRVSALVGWLRTRLDWACSTHPAIDEFNAAMWLLCLRLRRANGTERQLPERLDVPCRRPKCGWLALFRHPDEPDKVRCHNPDCQAVYTMAEYQQWCELLASWPMVVA